VSYTASALFSPAGAPYHPDCALQSKQAQRVIARVAANLTKQLIASMVAAVREKAATATGFRRAVWATLTDKEKAEGGRAEMMHIHTDDLTRLKELAEGQARRCPPLLGSSFLCSLEAIAIKYPQTLLELLHHIEAGEPLTPGAYE
jgi:hypothetical protein